MQFILIDRLIELEPGKRAVATKTFTPEEEFLTDHFPGFPVVPGVLLTEAMVQTGGWLILSTLNFSRWPFLYMIDKAKFRKFVKPGQNLRIEANLLSLREADFVVQSEVLVAERPVAQARIFYHSRTEPSALPDPRQFETWARRTFQRLGGQSLLQGVDLQDAAATKT